MCTANLGRRSGPLPRPTILERVDKSDFDPEAELKIKAARRAIIAACLPFFIK